MKRYKMLNFKVIIEKDGKFKKFGGTLWSVFCGTVVGNYCCTVLPYFGKFPIFGEILGLAGKFF
jgi:hypothetical protein